MANTGLAVRGRAEVAPAVNQEWDTPSNRTLIRQTVAPGLTEPEFGLFLHVARVRHLDPLQRQIHAVKRRTSDGKGGWEERMTLQTGIDGFRAIANRTGSYMPSQKLPKVEGEGTPELRVTVWVKKYAHGEWHEYGATAYYREFVQTRKDNNKLVPVAMWEKMPLGQTEKCAEAKALRRGWPEELGQIYVDEEMQQADPAPEPNLPRQGRTQREMGTLKVSTEPNRGHGNEGTQRQGTGNREQTIEGNAQPAKFEDEICAECRGVNGHADDCPARPKPVQSETGPLDTSALFDAPAAVQPPQMTEEEWLKRSPGHDMKTHISFKQWKLLFVIQNQLQLTDEVLKGALLEQFNIEHRHLIPKDKFQTVLDTIDPDCRFHKAKQ